jgi:hypothetical protein
MVEEYKIESSRRTCHECHRQFQPRDEYVSALFEVETDAAHSNGLMRLDFCDEHWQVNRTEQLAYWRTRVPLPEEPRKKRLVIDDERLLDVFFRLDGTADPGRVDLRYVIALMLIRKRRLKLDGSRRRGNESFMIVRKSRSKETFEVMDRRLSDEAVLAVSGEIGKLLDLLDKEAEDGEAAEGETGETS